MKNGFLMTGLGAAILAGTVVQAEDGHGHMGHQGERPGFETLDADGDGQVTRDEIAGRMQARFDAADTDGDGKLSRAELSARIEARQAEHRERRLNWMMEHRDADGDGALAMDEMRGGRAGHFFDRMDHDGDGAVSAEEFEKMKAKHRHGHGKHHKHD